MDLRRELLNWYAEKAGVRLLEACGMPGDGYTKVTITLGEEIYGISPTLTWQDLNLQDDIFELRTKGLLSDDFPDVYFERARRIGLDLIQRSQREGFEFYNGKLARLRSISTSSGDSPQAENLHLDIQLTSYFTAVGTNIHFQGYTYRHKQLQAESPLPQHVNWSCAMNWRPALRESPLANQFAIHLFLYNSTEILYVQRDRVGQADSYFNTTVNGVMEFKDDNPDSINGRPSIHATACRETEYELGIQIRPQDIQWLGVGVTHARSEPFVIGVCRIKEALGDLESAAMSAPEGREVMNRHTSFRRKAIHGIRISPRTQSFEVSAIGLTLPVRISLGQLSESNLRRIIETKILRRTETVMARQQGIWSDAGATSLLLCLAQLSNADVFYDTLEIVKRSYKGAGLSSRSP